MGPRFREDDQGETIISLRDNPVSITAFIIICYCCKFHVMELKQIRNFS